jgi:hypothetical protein
MSIVSSNKLGAGLVERAGNGEGDGEDDNAEGNVVAVVTSILEVATTATLEEVGMGTLDVVAVNLAFGALEVITTGTVFVVAVLKMAPPLDDGAFDAVDFERIVAGAGTGIVSD